MRRHRFVDENVARLEIYAKDTENLLKAGLATRNDLLKIQVQLSNAKLTQIDAVNDLQVALMNLNNLIGQDLQTEIELMSRPRVDSVDSDRTREALRSAWKPWRGISDRTCRRCRHGWTRRRRACGPPRGTGGRRYSSQGTTTIRARIPATCLPWTGRRDTWDFGVSVQMDIWNWGLTSAQIRAGECEPACQPLHV